MIPLLANPRWLAVRVTLSSLSVLLICAHAPDQSKGAEARQWWDDFSESVRGLSLEIPTIMMIDANVSLASVHEIRAPDVMMSKPTNALLADCFLDTCGALGLYVPMEHRSVGATQQS